ncbi:MAG: flippase-like domain-containing protein [Planctomycetes bacterium]|nr:flippase-like domain-containing protein [Planctomycetota bacterium]
MSALVAVVLIGLLATWSGVSWADVVRVCKRLSPAAMASAFGVHLAIHAVRAQRFRALIPVAHRPGYFPTFAAASSHNLAAYVLPAKTGEVSLIVYLKKLCGVPNKVGLSALVVSRLLDVSTLALALGVASTYLALFEPDTAPRGILLFGTGCILGAAALTALAARGDLIVLAVASTVRLLGADRSRFGAKLLDRSAELGTALRDAAGGALLVASLQSLAMWLGIFVFYAILAQALGLPETLGLAHTAIGSGFAVLSNLLPINSFAGFGTQEGGWVLGFGMLGVERELALSTGLGAHVFQLASTVALGLFGHLAMGLLGSSGEREAPRA